MLQGLFSDRVVTREGPLAGGDTRALAASELACVARAVPERRAEFAAVRALARSALEALGVVDFALVNDASGAPQWPAHVVGSITHTRRAGGDFGAVVAASAGLVRALGLDAEADAALNEELWPAVLCDEERAALAAVARSDRARAATLMFSAKECYYKCQFSLTRQFLDFSAAAVVLDRARGTFDVVVRQRAGHAFREGDVLPGRFVWRSGLVLTAIELDA